MHFSNGHDTNARRVECYDGSSNPPCAGCGERIHYSDVVWYDDDHGYCHEGCEPNESTEETAMKNAIVLDTETTGLNPSVARILEIAVVDLRSGAKLFHSYVNPGEPITAEITAINHITDEMVADAPSWIQVAPQVCEIISQAEAVIGQNIFFDQGMIDGEMQRLNDMKNRDCMCGELARVDRPCKSCSQIGVTVIAWPTLVCTKRTWDVFEPPNERRLMNNYKRFVDRAGFEDAHTALADTMACRAVLLAQEEEFGLHDKTWEEYDPERQDWFGPSHHVVWKADDNSDVKTLHLNFGKHKGSQVTMVDVGMWKWIKEKDFPDHVTMLAIKMIDFAHLSGPEANIKIHEWARAYEGGAR